MTKPIIETAVCSACKQEFKCPQSMLRKGFHHCWICYELKEQGVQEKDLMEQRKIKGPAIEAELLRNQIAGLFTDKLFPKLWKEEKELFEELDTENIAWEAYCAGTDALLEFITRENQDPQKTLKMLKKIKEKMENKKKD